MNDVRKNIQEAHVLEERLKEIFCSYFPGTKGSLAPDMSFPAWDFYLDWPKKETLSLFNLNVAYPKSGWVREYYEVKEVREATHYKHVPIKYRSHRKSSGILTTKADYWIFVCDSRDVYVIKTDKIRIAFKKRHSGYGLHRNSKGHCLFLMPIEELVKNCDSQFKLRKA